MRKTQNGNIIEGRFPNDSQEVVTIGDGVTSFGHYNGPDALSKALAATKGTVRYLPGDHKVNEHIIDDPGLLPWPTGQGKVETAKLQVGGQMVHFFLWVTGNELILTARAGVSETSVIVFDFSPMPTNVSFALDVSPAATPHDPRVGVVIGAQGIIAVNVYEVAVGLLGLTFLGSKNLTSSAGMISDPYGHHVDIVGLPDPTHGWVVGWREVDGSTTICRATNLDAEAEFDPVGSAILDFGSSPHFIGPTLVTFDNTSRFMAYAKTWDGVSLEGSLVGRKFLSNLTLSDPSDSPIFTPANFVMVNANNPRACRAVHGHTANFGVTIAFAKWEPLPDSTSVNIQSYAQGQEHVFPPAYSDTIVTGPIGIFDPKPVRFLAAPHSDDASPVFSENDDIFLVWGREDFFFTFWFKRYNLDLLWIPDTVEVDDEPQRIAPLDFSSIIGVSGFISPIRVNADEVILFHMSNLGPRLLRVRHRVVLAKNDIVVEGTPGAWLSSRCPIIVTGNRAKFQNLSFKDSRIFRGTIAPNPSTSIVNNRWISNFMAPPWFPLVARAIEQGSDPFVNGNEIESLMGH